MFAVAGITSSVDEIIARGMIEDSGTAIVATTGVGFGESEMAVLIGVGYGAVGTLADRIGRINNPWSVGIGYVERVNQGDVTHESKIAMAGRQIQGDFVLK